jgi:hypothetical protein
MTEVTYTTWARLEPRVSDPSLAPGIEAAVEDPLWLLGRQWQLGELDGEDTGSPIGVEVYGSWAPVERLLLGEASAQSSRRASDYDAAKAPLETAVAREPAPDRDALLVFGLNAAARVAQELATRGAPQAALAQLVADYPLDAGRLSDALGACGPAERARLELLAARLFDGCALLVAANDDFAATTAAFGADATDAIGAVLEAVAAEVDLAALKLRQAGAAMPGAWSSARLGSSFAVSASTDAGEAVLRADDWDGEQLDWWAFDLSSESNLGAKTKPAALTAPGGAPLLRLPGRLGFRGAPAVRYWEFEDNAVDFVSASAAAHESALMAVLQFAFVYGGDWSSVPIETPACSRVTISSVVVRDTFGMRVLVRHAGIDPTRPSDQLTRLWVASGDGSGSLLVAPRVGTTIQGEAVEETMLLRDEGANLAWAVELKAPDGAGHPVPWTAVAPPPAAPPESSTALPPDRLALHYRLSTDVPSHWFPLVPEAAGDRLASYRVGVLPSGSATPPRLPRALMLQELADSGLDEQELPRAGRRLTRRPQYARWADGSTHVWIGRRIGTGRGEGSSGLAYDVLEQSS